MTTEDFDPFNGRAHGDLVFRTNADRCFYIGLSASQKEKWLRDHPQLWKTREAALRDLQAGAWIDVEAEPAAARLPGEAKRRPDKATTKTVPLKIANADARAAAGDEIIIGQRRFISECRVAAMLGYSRRQLKRWRKEQKGPASTKIGRRWYYEINKLQEWIEREQTDDVGGRILADDAAFGINPPTSRP